MDRHFSELGLGNGRSGSSRKGKKSNSDKPKQPQRGLGVAQLEKIRLHSQMAAYLPSLHSPPFHSNLNKEGDISEDMACSQSFYSTSTSSSSLFGLHPNHMMASGENERHDIRYREFQSGSSASNFFMPHNLAQETTVTLPLLEDTVEDSVQWQTWQDRHRSTRAINQNSSSDTQELDLDLKLSL
ncbi:hypothetical protein J5N97_019755 [Dioscorea zingiberensis]|uniref:Protein SPEAR1-like n=1 Tax=Dioscorea zingiberensis TaxID=325984 RepID=A0A9D5CEG6_9LILI|nr:hypothetical protein J5N97_019755 [Dioscorea zingiberensis]